MRMGSTEGSGFGIGNKPPAGQSIRGSVTELSIARRLSGCGMAFDRLSALTQLTRLATEYSGGTKRAVLLSQLARLTGLRELDAPFVLQAQGGPLQMKAGHMTAYCC